MLKVLGWAGYDHNLKQVFDCFTRDSGIPVSFRGMRNQDDMLQAARAAPFDVACPTTDRLVSWLDHGLIAPLDETRIGYGRLDPAFRADAHTIIRDQRFGSPNLWGGAGIGRHTSATAFNSGDISLLTLFDPEFAGRLAMREDTAFVAVGRGLEHKGRLPYPFDDSYRYEDRMIANYDVIAAFLSDHASHVGRFWFSEEEGIDAFASGDCVIGYSWDTTMAALKRQGMPCEFIAPVEGANCYLQNFVLSAQADPGAAQDWISWVNTPGGSAQYAAAFGANPTAKGARERLPSLDQAFFYDSYPVDALNRLWWQPNQPLWFVRNRARYASEFRATVEG